LDLLVKEGGIEKSKWLVVTMPEIDVASFKKHFIWSGDVAEFPSGSVTRGIWGSLGNLKEHESTYLERYLSGSIRSKDAYSNPIITIVEVKPKES
jgi:hypothetical protein